MSTPTAAVPHYQVLIDELIAQHGAEMKPGGVYKVVVEHEDDCPALVGTGPCSCECTATLLEVADPLEPMRN